MRLQLIAVLMTVFLLQVSASAFTQNLTVSGRVTVKQLFYEIRKQTGYPVIWPSDRFDTDKVMDVSFVDTPLERVLDEMFKDSGFTYEIVNENVVIKAKKRSVAEKVRNFFSEEEMQQLTVRGKVTDTVGAPLPGVTVKVKGTNNGALTDERGGFELRGVEGNAILVFSMVGFESREIPADEADGMKVILKVLVSELEQLVVVGYGIQKRGNLTGAIDVISNQQLQNRQSPTVSQLLQGLSPGMSFSVNNFGFQPGAEMNIDVRGIGSLNGGEPYVLIDGIPGDMNRLNPEDIESISILKDAAASAIFGARAPYGVISITTKSGRTDGKISVTYSGSMTRAVPQRLPRMLDSYTHARVINEAGLNGSVGRIYTNETVDRIIAYQEGDVEYLRQFTVPDAIYFETIPANDRNWVSYQNANASYDWFDEYYGSALNHKHNLSMQGGGESTSYYFSAGFFGQDGVLNYGTDKYNRVNVMGKIKRKITDWWDFTYQPRFMKSSRVYPNMDRQGTYDLIFHQIARTMPMTPKYDAYGNYMVQSLLSIPMLSDAGTSTIEVTENWQTFTMSFRPLKGWDINADFAYLSEDYFRSDAELTVYEHLVDGSIRPWSTTDPSSIHDFHQSNNYWTSNIYSSYNFSLNEKHNFGLLAGTQLERNKARQLDASKNNLLVQDVHSLQTASGDPIVSENLSHWSTQGFFGRFTYNFDEKYLFEANIRRDGTSRFRRENRWGTFPSVALGWIVSKEEFWKSLGNTINSFKLRGSWGSLGNQNVSPYQDLSLIPLQTGRLDWIFGYGQNRPVGYTGTPGLVSPDLKWETATTKNLGADMFFLHDRLQLNFDWFERITTDMIGPSEARPGVLGSSVPEANNSILRTKGWELGIRWEHRIRPDFSYFVYGNVYDSRSVVTEYLNPTGILSTWYNGKEQGEIWGYTVHDLYRSQEEVDAHLAQTDLSDLWDGTWSPGDVRYEDITGDGIVDNGSNTIYDHGDLSLIGNSTPHYQFGLSMGLNFKGFDLSMLWKGTAKRDLFFGSGIDENIFWGFTVWNRSSVFPGHLDYYRDQEGDKYTGLYEGVANLNPDAYWPRPYMHTRENAKNRHTSTRYLQSGAYIRLQNVQLGYNFSHNLLSRLHLAKLRIYVAGENLFTATRLPKGIDPVATGGSWGSGKTYGADRMVYFGLIVTY